MTERESNENVTTHTSYPISMEVFVTPNRGQTAYVQQTPDGLPMMWIPPTCCHPFCLVKDMVQHMEFIFIFRGMTDELEEIGDALVDDGWKVGPFKKPTMSLLTPHLSTNLNCFWKQFVASNPSILELEREIYIYD